MAGHSKWASIKHKKKATDAKRGALFTKLTRAIQVAAREGGGDPTGNPALALAVQKAKDASMPKDNIERAIAKGTGADADAESFESVLYEGYGPAGVAVLVESLTDNRNRTGSEVRHIFTKSGGNLGEPGSVAWVFDKKGVIVVDADRYSEDDLFVAIDAGAEDVSIDENVYEVVTAPEDLNDVRQALVDAGVAARVRRARDAAQEHRRRARGPGGPAHAADGLARGARRRQRRACELQRRRRRARTGGGLTVEVDPAAVDPAAFVKAIKDTPDDQLAAGMADAQVREMVLDGIFSQWAEHFDGQKAGDTEAVLEWKIFDKPGGGYDRYQVVISGRHVRGREGRRALAARHVQAEAGGLPEAGQRERGRADDVHDRQAEDRRRPDVRRRRPVAVPDPGRRLGSDGETRLAEVVAPRGVAQHVDHRLRGRGTPAARQGDGVDVALRLRSGDRPDGDIRAVGGEPE